MQKLTLSLFGLTAFFVFTVSCKKDTDNQVPVVNAGPSQTITANTTTLNGSATDADGKVVAYLWSEVSGPSTPTIVNPGSASTQVTGFTLSGKYVFQLEATDNEGATGVDTMTIVVNTPTTLTLQPSNNPTEYTVAIYNGNDATGISNADLPIAAWTNGGLPLTIRAAVKFDLSSIPSTATILSANLYLYSYPAPTLNGNFTDPNFGTADQLMIQQITTSWSPGTISWFNQPSVTTTNQIISPVVSTPLDLNLDVTSMVSSMVSGNANYGFLLRLQNEVTYNSRLMVSSHSSTYPDKHPKLVIVWR